MFSTRSHVYNPDCDQITTSDEDLDRSPSRELAHYEAFEIGDDDSLSPDSQSTARPQFRNDSVDLDTTRSLSLPYEIESTPEQVVGNLPTVDMGHGRTKRNHSVTHSLAPSRLHITTKRARRTPDTTQDQSNLTATNAQSRSNSPVQIKNPETIDCVNTGSHFVRSFEALTSKYGENTDYDLKPAQVIEAIKAGDTFLREDCVDFITLYLEDCRDGLWKTPVPYPPLNGSLTENLFKSFHCAEILDQRIAVDPIRLQVARILLFWYYEQLCKESYSNPELSSRRSRGRDTASIATDVLIEEIFHGQKGQRDPQVWKRRRTSLQKQKQIGKRWSTLISCIGPGFLLICSPDLATYM